jgi:CelD/BcsL family acetyltransferase involved in cellulose biosynthesis
MAAARCHAYKSVRKSMSALTISVVRDRAGLQAIVPAWEALAAQACEPSPFYEPWILLPALGAQREGEGLRCICIWEGARLLGLFPFQRQRRYKGMPIATLASWRHSAYLLCTPLLRADKAADCLRALLAWRGADAAALELRYVPAAGPFANALASALRTSRAAFATTQRFSRPLLRKAPTAEAYLAQLSPRVRKDLARKERRLRERPGYAEVVLAPGDDFAAEIEQFMALEASGWKAAAGGAFACSETSLRFGREVLGEAARRGRLHLVGIDCDGRAIARRFTLLAGEGAFAFKTAYDESYARYSPGVLAELMRIRELHRLPHVQWADSYTDPENPTANRMWKERREMQSLAIGLGAWGDFWLSMLPLARWTAQRVAQLRSSASARANVSISR